MFWDKYKYADGKEITWLGRQWRKAGYYNFAFTDEEDKTNDGVDWKVLELETHIIYENNVWGGLIAVNKETNEILLSYI